MKVVSLPESVRNQFAELSNDALSRGELSLGFYTNRFEGRLADDMGITGVVALNSGTAALDIAFQVARRRGCRTITIPEMTVPMVYRLAISIFDKVELADVDDRDFAMSGEPGTDAICLVTTGGIPSPRIEDFAINCKKRGIFIIEDASHSHGCVFGSTPTGQLGHVMAQSWYATKVLTMGEGGIFCSKDADDLLFAQRYSNQGKRRGNKDYAMSGVNYRPSSTSVILGLCCWNSREEIYNSRRELANTMLRLGAKYVLPNVVPERTSFFKFPVLMNSERDASKIKSIIYDEFGYIPGTIHDALAENISNEFHSYRSRVSSNLDERQVCLPMSFSWGVEDVDKLRRVILAINREQ